MSEIEATEKAGESFFRKMTSSMWQMLAMQLPQLAPIFLSEMQKHTPNPLAMGWQKWLNGLVDKKMIDQDTADLLGSIEREPWPLDIIGALVARLAIFRKEIDTSLEIYGLDRQYAKMAATTPNPAPVDNLVRSMIIDPGRANENRSQLKKYGYSDDQIDNIILSYYRTYDEGTIRTCYLRGIISVEKMYERMHELGYTDTRIKEIVPTWEIIPGPQDLFTMVAHEAFEPDIYKYIGLDEEFPAEQIGWLKKSGISEDWARKYWISHWNEPSLEMGFDMLHRGIINMQELDMLFRIVEIPRWWRDKLTKIAFNPYTRVDTRRMHEMGVLSTAELVTAYQDLGYDGAHAMKMAEFTIRYNAEGDNKLTRSAITASYRDDLISRTDALEMMKSQNLSQDAADYYLTLEDYKIAQESVKIYTDTIKDRFLLGLDSENDARSELNKMNLRGSKIEALLDNWSIDRYKYEQLPSKSDIDNMLIQKVITEGSWRTIMTRLGYTFEHQAWYLKLMNRQLTIGVARPTKADLQAWYKKKLVTEDYFRSEMSQLGYSDQYIHLYLKSM